MYGDLSFIAFAALSFVAGSTCAHAADLAAAYGIDKSIVSRQIRELQAQGLLDREPDPDHARMQRLTLTSRGRDLLHQTRLRQRKGLDEALNQWSDDDIATFSGLFRRFVDHLNATESHDQGGV